MFAGGYGGGSGTVQLKRPAAASPASSSATQVAAKINMSGLFYLCQGTNVIARIYNGVPPP